MQLAKHIAQGKLIYLGRDQDASDAISVSENEHYRWLAFKNADAEQIIQSIMLKRKPWKLPLPHQTAMMLPLLFCKPKSLVELGLGGGNIQRFIKHLSADIMIESVEHNSVVIDCFNQYFNPDKNQTQIIYNDSSTWLKQNKIDYDWYVCDVYQQTIQSYHNAVNQIEHITRHIKANTCLSINVPDANDHEVNLLLTILLQLSPHHNITYFHIPNYLNIVIHLIPKQWQTYKRLKRNNHSHLPQNTFERWKSFWQYGKEVSL